MDPPTAVSQNSWPSQIAEAVWVPLGFSRSATVIMGCDAVSDMVVLMAF